MTVSIVHAKVNTKPDAGDTSIVRPVDWNAEHVLSGTLDDAQLPDKIVAAGPVGSASAIPVITFDAKGRLTTVTTASVTVPAAANPTASVGLSAVNGSAGTFMRSDGAPALDQTIVPTWTGQHTWANGTITTSKPMTLTQTWNAAVTFTGYLANITSTTFTTPSRFIDLQQNNVSMARFELVGNNSSTDYARLVFGRNQANPTLGITLDAVGSSLNITHLNAASLNASMVLYGSSNVKKITWDAAASGSGTCMASDLQIGWSSGAANFANDLILTRAGAAALQLGAANAASPVAQTLQAQGSRAGTDNNVGGASVNYDAGTGTGTGTLATAALRSPVAVASGTGAQTIVAGITAKAGTAVLTSYTVATLPAAATAGAGATAFVTDANTTIILGLGLAVVGGGANKVPVYSDGTNWLIG